MSETPAEVCLVRCPKCESLLPEVTDYPVYQCGGCGAVLRANRKPIESPTVSNEEIVGVSNNNSEELQNINFLNQKTKNSSSEFDQDDLTCNENMRIDQKLESLKINQESQLEVEDDRVEILLKLDEIKDQIVRSKQKSSFFNNSLWSQAPIQAPYHPQFHHHLCCCLICYNNRHHPLPPPPPPPPLPPPFHYPHDYNAPRLSTLQKPHTHWSGSLHRPRRGILATTGRRRCRLVAGGSPFLACPNCSQLLQMPTKNTKKLKCATCSEVILLSVVNKKLISHPENGVGNNNKNKNTHRNLWRANTRVFSSKDFDVSSDFDFKWLDRSLSVSRQNSMKEVATEIKILPNEYRVNTGTSQESIDQEDDTLRHESFFLDMIKKSFKLSRPNHEVDHGKVKVTVNGHPLNEGVVKKAEKISGPIQPGDYWYDSTVGFWGMMGGPCRGIIPPYIEEFNYPMPENCANGDTGVFVNGRELHEKDLDLLASRGLPMDRNRSYIIEISGRVLEEGSGMELLCLGKLAPTIEKKRHGFGMKPPRLMA